MANAMDRSNALSAMSQVKTKKPIPQFNVRWETPPGDEAPSPETNLAATMSYHETSPSPTVQRARLPPIPPRPSEVLLGANANLVAELSPRQKAKGTTVSTLQRQLRLENVTPDKVTKDELMGDVIGGAVPLLAQRRDTEIPELPDELQAQVAQAARDLKWIERAHGEKTVLSTVAPRVAAINAKLGILEAPPRAIKAQPPHSATALVTAPSRSPQQQQQQQQQHRRDREVVAVNVPAPSPVPHASPAPFRPSLSPSRLDVSHLPIGFLLSDGSSSKWRPQAKTPSPTQHDSRMKEKEENWRRVGLTTHQGASRAKKCVRAAARVQERQYHDRERSSLRSERIAQKLDVVAHQLSHFRDISDAMHGGQRNKGDAPTVRRNVNQVIAQWNHAAETHIVTAAELIAKEKAKVERANQRAWEASVAAMKEEEEKQRRKEELSQAQAEAITSKSRNASQPARTLPIERTTPPPPAVNQWRIPKQTYIDLFPTPKFSCVSLARLAGEKIVEELETTIIGETTWIRIRAPFNNERDRLPLGEQLRQADAGVTPRDDFLTFNTIEGWAATQLAFGNYTLTQLVPEIRKIVNVSDLMLNHLDFARERIMMALDQCPPERLWGHPEVRDYLANNMYNRQELRELPDDHARFMEQIWKEMQRNKHQELLTMERQVRDSEALRYQDSFRIPSRKASTRKGSTAEHFSSI